MNNQSSCGNCNACKCKTEPHFKLPQVKVTVFDLDTNQLSSKHIGKSAIVQYRGQAHGLMCLQLKETTVSKGWGVLKPSGPAEGPEYVFWRMAHQSTPAHIDELLQHKLNEFISNQSKQQEK